MRLIVPWCFFVALFVLSSIAQDRMTWWRDARFGMFIHWGAYAQLHGWWNSQQTTGLGEWIMNDKQISIPNYETSAAAPFNPTQFNAASWVSVARSAGQKYIVITSKHHEGFSHGLAPSVAEQLRRDHEQ
jgi:alpha-L-fucosidase